MNEDLAKRIDRLVEIISITQEANENYNKAMGGTNVAYYANMSIIHCNPLSKARAVNPNMRILKKD